MPKNLVIASRESRLAMWQAEHVRDVLQNQYPDCTIRILGMSTQGDRILDRPLAQIGGKGLFIKELENALWAKEAHLAVHSMKDVPMVMPEGFALPVIFSRENPCDAFVSPRYQRLEDLPEGAVVGTSSLRREALLRHRFPKLTIRSLRGNLDTRLRKLDQGEYDAIILAAAGLTRLGLKNRIRAILPPEVSLPAPGQGALGIEIVADNHELADWLKPLHDNETAACVTAERAFSRALGGSCQIPLGGHAILQDGKIWLRGFVSSVDGSQRVAAEVRGDMKDAEILGLNLAQTLRDQGADAILAQLPCAPASNARHTSPKGSSSNPDAA